MLNDTQCRKAKPMEMPYKLSDEKGLYLEIKPNGVKAWRYHFELVRAEGRKDGRTEGKHFRHWGLHGSAFWRNRRTGKSQKMRPALYLSRSEGRTK